MTASIAATAVELLATARAGMVARCIYGEWTVRVSIHACGAGAAPHEHVHASFEPLSYCDGDLAGRQMLTLLSALGCPDPVMGYCVKMPKPPDFRGNIHFNWRAGENSCQADA